MEEQELAKAEAMGPDRVPPKPRPAAGVILARDEASGPEVLLVRRRSDLRFAAGAYVFPGGTLHVEDSDPAWERWLSDPPAEALLGAADADGPSAHTFVVAALREMFEETGVLLSAANQPPESEMAAERRALVAGRRRFLDIIADRGIQLAADRLVLCARWVTPEALSRRYDARFFLAEAPLDVQIEPETGELVEHIWIQPAAALESYFEGDFEMLFPTAKTLGWLETGRRVAEWFGRFRAAEVAPITPRIRRVGGEVASLMPDEPGYDEPEDDG
jgi:8-oxo-dGTP pyrophosphatase MutT (NUDIX family)